MNQLVPKEVIEKRILLVRGQKVMLDFHLAVLSGVPTKRLNEQVRHNIKRFPEDFMFQLTWEEQRSSSEISPICLHRTRCCDALFGSEQRQSKLEEME